MMVESNRGKIILHTKIKTLVISNIIFFAIIAFHHMVINNFGDDWVVYVMLLSTFAVSSVILEDTIRQKALNIRIIALIEFGLRVVGLSVHLVSIMYDFNLYWLIGIFTSLLILTFIFQSMLLKHFKKSEHTKSESFDSRTLNNAIDKLYYSDSSYISNEQKKERTDKLKKAVQALGNSNILLFLIVINLIVTNFLFKHYRHYIFIPIFLAIVLVFKFLKSHYSVYEFSSKKKNTQSSYVLTSVLFVIGIVVLHITEVFYSLPLGGMRVIIWFLAALMFIPIMNSNYLLVESLKDFMQNKQKDGEDF